MNQDAFHDIVSGNKRPVILLEGTRSLPAENHPRLVRFGSWVAALYPHAVFRTGNADGSDSAFARGVASVDPSRLEFVLPYRGHRKHSMAREAYQFSLDTLSTVEEERASYATAEASPKYDSMLKRRHEVARLKFTSAYLLRDTLKVTGVEGTRLTPATVGIFYVNPSDPMKGGTGHTIRVCQRHGVPVAFQDQWLAWIENCEV